MGYYFRPLDPTWVHCSDPCSLQDGAADSLEAAALSVNDYITINSAFRSSAEQYLLYQWYLKKVYAVFLGSDAFTADKFF